MPENAPGCLKWFPEDRKEVFVPTAKAERGDLVISVKELGNVKAERSIAVNSEIEGKVIYLIQEGVTVKPGDLLVQVDDTPLKDKVRTETLANSNAMSQVEKAKLEMEILKESNKTDYEQAEAQLNYDKEELKRCKRTSETGAAAKTALCRSRMSRPLRLRCASRSSRSQRARRLCFLRKRTSRAKRTRSRRTFGMSNSRR